MEAAADGRSRVCSNLGSVDVGNRCCIVCWQRWRATEKLVIDVASVGGLGDVVACASEGLFAHRLASELLLAFVVFGYEHFPNQGLAASSFVFAFDLDPPKEPEAA